MLRESKGHIPQLDSLRMFAVMGVLFSHFVPQDHAWRALYLLPFGPLGVQLFFVLSGFLITGILLKSKEYVEGGIQTAWFSFRQFYIRRSLRIFPIYYLTLVVASFTFWPVIRDSILWHTFYMSNFFLVSLNSWSRYVSHLWTLSVEEQFYLLWPIAVFMVPRRWLGTLIVCLILTAPVWRLGGVILEASSFARETLLPGCFDSLGMGALLALFRSEIRFDVVRRLVSRAGLLVALPLYLGLTFVLADSGDLLAVVRRTLTALFFFYLVDGACRGYRGASGWILNRKFLRYLGKISYGIYLFHPFAPMVYGLTCRTLDIDPSLEWDIIFFSVTSVVGAAISWHLLEKPINGLKARFSYKKNIGRFPDG